MSIENATYRELELLWKTLRRARDDIALREVACVNAPRTLLCVEIGDRNRPSIALAAGIHGDEPAGPAALLELAHDGLLDPAFAYRIWPCTNPSGFDARTRASIDGIDLNRSFSRGGQSPEARAIVMANRDRKFALSIDLHEDCDASGFYCYEYGGGAYGLAALRALEGDGFPIESLETLDLGFPAAEPLLQRERGRITADARREGALIDGLSYSLLIARNAARHVLTFETPSSQPWERRVTMHRRALLATIATLPRPADE